LWILVLAAREAGWPYQLSKIVVSLLSAWVVIRLVSRFIREPVWSRFLAVSVWSVAALSILGLLQPTIRILDTLAFEVGTFRVSVLGIGKGLLLLAVLLWVAGAISRLLERRITAVPSLTPSVQVLFTKLLKIVLVTIAVVAAVSSVGIDLTAFALVGGAVGVGLGFGLQKVVSNLVSGVILLLDRSVKPGDVISIGETYGWINTLGARYASVVTRDGLEFLIPNEDLITQQVVNWSFSTDAVRLRIPIGVSYKSDVRQAIDLCMEAAVEEPRVIDMPKPVCLLTGFGDSSVDLELRMWISDPKNGVGNVKSSVMLRVWDKFHEHDIEIPFPQRDLHLKSPETLMVTTPSALDPATDAPRG
jgi:small-conductance mechanosensitive channel